MESRAEAYSWGMGGAPSAANRMYAGASSQTLPMKRNVEKAMTIITSAASIRYLRSKFRVSLFLPMIVFMQKLPTATNAMKIPYVEVGMPCVSVMNMTRNGAVRETAMPRSVMLNRNSL